MDQRIYHGKITPSEICKNLYAAFNRGYYQVQQLGDDQHMAVQIATRQFQTSGGQTALTIDLRSVEDGISIQIGKQDWGGIAASLGMTAFAALVNPFNLISRLDNIAQDIESLRLSEEVWQVIESVVKANGVSTELSDRLRSVVCAYCGSANPVGLSNCKSCGAPMGNAQPRTCKHCGFVLKGDELICPNCSLEVKNQ